MVSVVEALSRSVTMVIVPVLISSSSSLLRLCGGVLCLLLLLSRSLYSVAVKIKMRFGKLYWKSSLSQNVPFHCIIINRGAYTVRLLIN